nr:hypothetical protein Iba_chr06aCG4340 [Ipomoea batatas]
MLTLLHKTGHLANPSVCEPNKATNSLSLNPLMPNFLTCSVKFSDGPTSWVLAPVKFAVLASSRPKVTVYVAPLNCSKESRAAIDKMSAQDTGVSAHLATAFCLACSITSNPLTELRLPNAVCSPVNVAVSFRRSPASQPSTKQSWKKRRMREAPMRVSLSMAASTTSLTAENTQASSESMPGEDLRPLG